MVARQKRAISSSEGALLIDDLFEWLDGELAKPPRAAVRRRHPQPDRVAARIALAWFLLQTTSKPIEFEPELLLEPERSLGWDLVVAEGHRGGGAAIAGGRPGADPDYRFAVVQAELFRRHLRSAVVDLDPVPLARYLSHFSRWYAAAERSPQVEAVAAAVLDEGVRGVGLEVA